jgi:hypothetical protein
LIDDQNPQTETTGAVCATGEVTLSRWRQGDFTLIGCGFLAAVGTEEAEAFEAAIDGDVVGLAVVSQTCDIVRMQPDRRFVVMCPLVKRDEKVAREVGGGRRPNLFRIDGAPEQVFADISRMMSVDKTALADWPRSDGFSTEDARARFGAALERKFGRFAFPDEFETAVKKFQERVWSRHDKADSEPGKVYRSLEQIRFAADPGWDSRPLTVTLVAILHPEGKREVDREMVQKELEQQIALVKLADGMTWSDPALVLATLDDLSARDYLSSQRADFDFLCD